MAQTFNVSRILTRRFQFNFPACTWVIPNIKIHTDHLHNELSLVPGDVSTSKDKDLLLHNIRKANSSGELFNIIAAHGQLFNQRHVIESLSCLHEFNKAKEFDITSRNVTTDPIFEKLCIQLKKFSRVLELNEIIEALKVLTLLNVPSKSTIFQMLLQLIRSNINNLEMDQVIFLDYILRKCEPNHLIDAIQLALPLVFQLNVSSKMDKENVPELTKLLRYAAVNNIPHHCVTSIATSLVIHNNNIDFTSAKAILFALTEHRFRSSRYHIVYEKLLDKSFSVVLANMNNLSFLEILKLLERLKEMIVLQHNYYYNMEFFDACGNYVIDKKLPFVSSIQVSRIMTRVAHIHLPLLEYISQHIILHTGDIETCRPRHLISFMNALSNANYRPDFFEEIKEKIKNNQMIGSTKIEMPWSKFGMDLAVLDIYDENLIKKIFSKDFLKEYLARKNSMMDHLQLLILYQAVRTFHPSIHVDFPADIYQKAVGINCSREVDETMKAVLTNGLGGTQYLASQVQMPLGIFADFVVAFREEVYPVAINSENHEGPIMYRELNLPSSTNLLCIMNYHKGCYSINNQRLRGNFDLINRILEKLGYKVLAVSLTDWLEMPDIEKTLFLMREIKYKFSQDGSNVGVKNNVT